MIPEFAEREPYERGFKAHYDAKIKPLLGEFEEKRKAMSKLVKKRIAISILIDIAIIAATVLVTILTPVNILAELANMADGDGIFLYIGLLVAPYSWALAPIVKFKKGYKNKVLPVICEFFGGFSYSETGEEVSKELLKSGLFPGYTSKKSEDFITGSYKENQLSMHELLLRRKSSKTTVTVFKGMVVTIEFPKAFTGKTLIRKDQGRLMNWMQSDKGLDRIELEDPRFEEIFEVHGTDQVEARFLLTTAFMERLIQLADRVNKGRSTTGIQALFEGKQLVLAVPSNLDLFEPKRVHKSAFDLEDLHTFLAQMNDIFTLIDVLKLDRR